MRADVKKLGKFRVDGASLDGLPPTALKARAVLDRLANGELCSRAELRRRINCGAVSIYHVMDDLIEYTIKVEGRRYWGNRRTIKCLRKRMGMR